MRTGFAGEADIDQTNSNPSTRTEGMSARRAHILACAEKLIRRDRATSFSMRELGHVAELSTATVYNLIGSKSTVLYGLLISTLDRLMDERSRDGALEDPVAFLLQSGGLAASMFIHDAALLKPLFQHLLGVPDAVHRPVFMRRVYDYWFQAASRFGSSGLLKAPMTPGDLARQLQIISVGVLELWIHDEVDDAQFLAEVEHGLTVQALPMVTGRDEKLLAHRLDAAREILRGRYNATTSFEASLAE